MKMFRGLLGWSNKRNGLEVYRWDPKIVPRHKSEWGDLFVEEHADALIEGSTVLLVTLPRRATVEEIAVIEAKIAGLLARWEVQVGQLMGEALLDGVNRDR